MAAAADPIMLFQEVSPLFFVLMIQEKRIDCQPTVRIIAAPCEISVYFIFRDELFILIPVKALSCGKILIRLCKLPEQCRHLIRLIKVHPHQVFIFGIGFPQRGQSFIEIGQKSCIIQQARQPVRQFRETAPEDFCILKHCFGNAIGQITLHISQCLRVFLQSILPCSIQNRLRCVLPLSEQFMDAVADILPRKKRIDNRAALCRTTCCNAQPQIIEPDGILCTVNFKALATRAVFIFHELRIFFRGFLDHKIVDQAQLALAAVAARAQDFIDHFGIKCNFIRIPRLDRCFNGADLLFHGRQIRKRKSRGNFFLCFANILFCCRFG